MREVGFSGLIFILAEEVMIAVIDAYAGANKRL